MKLTWRLNALVLLFCLSVSLCAEVNNLNLNNNQNKNSALNQNLIKNGNTLSSSITNQVLSSSGSQITNTNKVELQSKSQVSNTVSATTSASTLSQTESEKKKNSYPHLHSHHKSDIYSANEKMLKKFEKERHKLLQEQESLHRHSFMQNKDKSTAEFELENEKNVRVATESTVTKKGITFVHLKNTKLTLTKKEWLTYSKCQEKKGFLEIIQNENSLSKKINLVMTRVVLNPESLRLYTTMDENSLFTTIKLESILKISQEEKFIESGCFDIILNKAFAVEKYLQKRRITICTPDKVKMGEWVHAIFEFKECGTEFPSPKGAKIVLDFNEVNKIKKEDNKDMWNLWYDNSRKAYVNKALANKENVIAHTVKKLITNIEMKNYAQAKVERELEGKLKEAQEFSREMDKKHELIERIIKKKLERQNALQVENVQKTAVGKEVQLISAMAAKLSDMKVTIYFKLFFKNISFF
jgi:hypothetical protein